MINAREDHREGVLAVALHGVAPDTLEHCALIREWLADLGVRRVTLCASGSSPALAGWLADRRSRGDAVVPPGAVVARRPAVVDWYLGSGLPGAVRTLRIDLRPDDFDRRPRRTRAVERTLRRAARCRRAVTFDELGGPGSRLRADIGGVLRAP